MDTVQNDVVLLWGENAWHGKREGLLCLDPGIADALGTLRVRISHPVYGELLGLYPGYLVVV
jgi:hypothetical protein